MNDVVQNAIKMLNKSLAVANSDGVLDETPMDENHELHKAMVALRATDVTKYEVHCKSLFGAVVGCVKNHDWFDAEVAARDLREQIKQEYQEYQRAEGGLDVGPPDVPIKEDEKFHAAKELAGDLRRDHSILLRANSLVPGRRATNPGPSTVPFRP